MDKISNYNEAAEAIGTDKGAEYLGQFSCMSTDLLVKIAAGKVNAQAVAAAMLACRGLDNSGKWIGFDNADKFWSSK
jgi:hypothetical protein